MAIEMEQMAVPVLDADERFMGGAGRLAARLCADGGAYAVADRALVSLTVFVTGIVAGRVLPPAEFGFYILGFSLILVFMNIQNALIALPCRTQSPRLDLDGRARLAGSMMARRTLVLLALAAVQISLVVWLAASGRLTAPLACLVMGFSCGVPVLGRLLVSKRRFTFSMERCLPDFRRSWSLGKWLLAGSVGVTLSIQLYPWLLVAVKGSASAGVFGACIGPLLFLTPFLLGAVKLFSLDIDRAFAEEGVEGLERAVLRSTHAVGGVMTLFCVVMAIAGGDLVILLYGQTYVGQGMKVALLALGLFASSLTLPAQCGLVSLKRPDAGFISHILALAVALPLGVWLASEYGVTGAACAYLAASVTASLYRYAVYARELKKARA